MTGVRFESRSFQEERSIVKRSYPKADLAEWTGYPSSSLKRRSNFGESLVIIVEFYQNKALAG
jgi:hypothetical protein